MDLGELFTSMPSWALFALVTVIAILTAEAGARVGKSRLQSGKEAPKALVGTAVSAMLSLLAFMLGFTFSITADRFGDRKDLVIKQANAIRGSYLRSNILPEKQKNATRYLYREYLYLLTDIKSDKVVNERLDRIDEIHALLWEQAASLAREDMDPILRSFFTATVIEVNGLMAERQTVGLVFRIPNALWAALIFLAAMCMFVFGYQNSINGGRRIFEMHLLPISFAMIIVLIADMDSMSKDRFKVSLKPLENLQKMINKDFP